jgi:hypothetical protein
VAQDALSIVGLDDEVPAVRAHHQAGVQRHARSANGTRPDIGAKQWVIHAACVRSAASRSLAGGCE